MATNYNEKRKGIFKIFSQNLEWVKEHPSLSFVPDFANGYLCPLCSNIFFEEDCYPKSNNSLSLEHVPPETLGGKSIILTCKACNNKSGHVLDVNLLNKLIELDSCSFMRKSKADTKFELFDIAVNGTFEVDERGTAIFDFQSDRSNPQDFSNFKNYIKPPPKLYDLFFCQDKMSPHAVKVKMKFRQKSKERHAEIALLRIAFLLSCATFGNGFFMNYNLRKVRQQILNPNDDILPKVFWIKYQFSREMEGINILTLPRDIRCFIVIFSLRTECHSRQFAIALPGPSEPGIKVYDYIEKYLCQGDGTQSINIKLEHLPQADYLKNKEYAFASHYFWQIYTKS